MDVLKNNSEFFDKLRTEGGIDGAALLKLDLSGSLLKDLSLNHITFKETKLSNVDLHSSILKEPVFEQSSLESVRLINTTLTEAIF